jgi:tripartite-type tricarboxylate transporter receptor subunit TctC
MAALKAVAIIPRPTHASHPGMPIRRPDPASRHICIVRHIRKLPRRTFLKFAAAAVVAPAFSRLAPAQTYPSRPITMIVPFPAGGAIDVIARNLAERMKASLGQPVIIENVTGASGSIGVGRVARAAPDGYMLSLGQNDTHVVNGATYVLRYDVVNDFEPVVLISATPRLILAKNAMPADDLKGLIAWLKANPGKATYGTAGFGSTGQVIGLLFKKETGTRFQSVPYRGGAQTLKDLVAGQIDFCILDPTTSLSVVRAGLIKAYAVMDRTRIASAPEIPTVDEAGLPGFYDSWWNGLWVPKGTPKDIIAKLNAAVVEALADPGVRARLADLGQEIFRREQQTPEALAAFQKAEIEKWWPIIKAFGIKAE